MILHGHLCLSEIEILLFYFYLQWAGLVLWKDKNWSDYVEKTFHPDNIRLVMSFMLSMTFCCWYTWQASSECFKCVLVFNWFLNWLLHELMHVLLHSCNDLRHNWTNKRFRWWFVRAVHNIFHSLTSVIVSHLVLIFSDAWLPFNPQANYSINDTDQSLVPGLIISSDFLRKRKEKIQFFFG